KSFDSKQKELRFQAEKTSISSKKGKIFIPKKYSYSINSYKKSRCRIKSPSSIELFQNLTIIISCYTLTLSEEQNRRRAPNESSIYYPSLPEKIHVYSHVPGDG